MPLGTLDRTPPPFFKQGPSALSKLIVFSALAVFLMVADTRFAVVQQVRAVLGSALYPLQMVALQPVALARGAGSYFGSLEEAQRGEAEAERRLALQSQRAGLVEQLQQENARLRKLMDLRAQASTEALAAEVLYDAPDPYTRKVIIDKGATQGVELGAPVLDEFGVLGQVTQVQLLASEVTLLVDRDQAIPVLNTRSGARSVAYGDPVAVHEGGLELRFMPSNADVKEGDLLATSGVDGVYPPGLPVARVLKVEHRADSSFARIYCKPEALMMAARHVLVLKPLPPSQVPARAEPAPPATRKAGRK